MRRGKNPFLGSTLHLAHCEIFSYQNMKHTIKIYTLGCKVNQYDSGWLVAKFKEHGFNLVKSAADFAVINTCAVTKNALKKNKSMINKAKTENPKAKIVIIGCWPKTYQINAEDLNVDMVTSSRELEDVINLILKNLDKKKNDLLIRDNLVATDKAKYFLKIQDGCEQFCTYCIIPFARGKIKSRDQEEIVEEIKSAINKGYQEFILTGIHLGQYGKDLQNINLVNLLKNILQIEDLGRIRLSSIEINEVTDELIDLMASNKKLCKHLHIPLQSGYDKILKLMNRPYDTKFFRERVNKIKKAMPDIALTTDVIVGFPRETEADFKITYNFIKEINFSRLHIFPFSAHEKTKAHSMPDQVGTKEKQERAKRLKNLDCILQKQYKDKFSEKIVEVLIESRAGDEFKGKAEQYFDVIFSPEQALGDKKTLKVKSIFRIKLI